MSQQNQLEPTGFTTRTIHAVHDARYDASVPPVHTAGERRRSVPQISTFTPHINVD